MIAPASISAGAPGLVVVGRLDIALTPRTRRPPPDDQGHGDDRLHSGGRSTFPTVNLLQGHTDEAPGLFRGFEGIVAVDPGDLLADVYQLDTGIIEQSG